MCSSDLISGLPALLFLFLALFLFLFFTAAPHRAPPVTFPPPCLFPLFYFPLALLFLHRNDFNLTAREPPFCRSRQPFAVMSDNSALEVVEVVEEGVMEGSTRSAWEGSDVSRAELDWLIRTRRISAGVEC